MEFIKIVISGLVGEAVVVYMYERVLFSYINKCIYYRKRIDLKVMC